MTKKKLNKIKTTKKWPFEITSLLNNLFLLIFPLGITIINFAMIKSGFLNDDNKLITAGFIGFLIGLFLIIFLLKKLHQNQFFTSYTIQNLTHEKIKDSLIAHGFDNYNYHEIGYFQIRTDISWFSWGGIVTIVPNENELLVNIKSEGMYGVRLPIASSRDKKNIQKFINELKRSAF